MVDIASLGFKIDTSDVAKADSALDGLATTGAKTEAAAKGVGKAWTDAGRKTGAAATQMGSTSSAIKQGNEALRAQQAELGKLLGQINPVVAALDRLDKQEAELRKFKSKGLVDIDTFREYKAQIDSSRASLAGVDGAIRRTGNTSKQTAQALRQLPAQFSDIAISLQAGQSPLTVFLQQGAQIKDSFGGAVPALRAVGGAALGMINPVTLAAAALAALAFAYKQGSDEGTAFNTALILTGNIAGTSVGQLQNAAAAMDKVSGTQRQAAQALAEVAGTGKFTTEQILSIATAAVAMEDATGKAISDTVAEFKKLADEPAAAAAKLNEQYNFLTAAVYDQITALESQGDAAGAAQLAIDSYGQAMQDRATEITNDLGYVERAWKAIKDGASEAWDEMLGVGRTQTPEQRLDELTNRGIDAERTGTAALFYGAPGAAISFGRQLYEQVGTSATDRNEEIGKAWQEIQDRDEKAWVEGMNAQQERDAIAAQQRIDQLSKTVQTNAEKRAKALGELQKDLAKIRAANPGDSRLEAGNIAQLEKNIAEQYKDPKAAKVAKAPAVRDDAGARMLASLRQQYAQLVAQDEITKRMTDSQRELVRFQQQIADLKNKSILTADQKSLVASSELIEAQLKRNAAVESEALARKEIQRSMEGYERLAASLLSKEEKQLAVTRDRLQVLDAARKSGLSDTEFKKTATAIASNSTYEAPNFAGVDSAVAGPLGELSKLDDAQDELNKWYESQVEALRAFRSERSDLNAQWDAQELVLKQQHEDSLAGIERARWQTGLAATSDFLNQLQGLREGDSEKGKKVAKAAAITQATINAYTAATGAYASASAIPVVGWVLGPVAAAAALAAGLANVATIKGQAHDGIMSVPSSGTWNLEKGERVLTAETSAAMDRTLAEVLINQRAGRDVQIGGAAASSGGASAGAPTTIVNQMSFPGITDSREAKRSTAQASRQIARAVAGAGRYN